MSCSRSKIHLSVYWLALYFLVLPIGTALSGLVGDISVLNYIAVGYLVFAITDCRARIVLRRRFCFVYAYVFYAMFSFLWSGVYQFDWYVATFVINALILVFALSRSYSEKEKDLLKKAILLSGVICIIISLFHISSALEFRLYITLTSTMDPNDFACGLSVIIAYLLLRLQKQRGVLNLLMLLALLGIIILSGSRTAMLMCALMIALWVAVSFVQGKRIANPKLTMLIMLAVPICVLLLIGTLPAYLLDRMDISSLFKDNGAGRFSIWKAALREFATSNPLHMLVGHGHGSFRTAVNYIAPGHTEPYYAHNMFVNALIEGGLIGLGFLLLAFAQGFKWSYKKKNIVGLLCLAALAIEGMGLDVQTYRIFPIAFVMVWLFEEPTARQTNLENSDKTACCEGEKNYAR